MSVELVTLTVDVFSEPSNQTSFLRRAYVVVISWGHFSHVIKVNNEFDGLFVRSLDPPPWLVKMLVVQSWKKVLVIGLF